ncbi:MAG TPA: hypothetical protein PLJ71_22025 [Candidatus Hydrogenedentes bacterium]|nr:hypothetical protein [Candidatus Hydrogenedentota bacterium]HQM51367.1 hypothetical protein [Candidatus Hydrogenedentota bacterium]
MMETHSESRQFCALVKYAIHADHLGRAYSFRYFTEATPAQLAVMIADEFINRVDEAISNRGEVDEDLEVERAELEQRLAEFREQIKASGNLSQVDGFGDSIEVVYPTYEFTVLAAGSTAEFNANALSALEEDEDFSSFLENHLEDIDSDEETGEADDERLLALEFQRLSSSSPAELTHQDILPFLKKVEEFVFNDEM